MHAFIDDRLDDTIRGSGKLRRFLGAVLLDRERPCLTEDDPAYRKSAMVVAKQP